jgi:NAD(P)-dependent dehydrogenase (short-subunit alcohol dehydrogenase family)
MAGDAQVWFITGCSTGFGREIAKIVLANGWRAVLTARSPDRLAEFAAQYGDRALILPLDVTDQAMIDDAISKAEAHFGGIDVLVNNAGYGYISAIEEGEDAEVRREFETNVFGLIAMTKAVLPGMRRKRRGHILNISSMGGLMAFPALGYYNASKFAVEGLSEALSQEVAPLGIKVTIVEPGRFRTDFGGRSIAVSKTVINDYDDTAGARKRTILSTDGKQPGDPVKAAAAIVDIAQRENPPLRLLLGQDAYDMMIKRLDTQRQDFESLADISVSTAFPAPASG